MGQSGLSKHFISALLVGFTFLAGELLSKAPEPQLWYWHHSFLISDEAVRKSEALIDRAVACGYTGVAFWDDSFQLMSDPSWPAANVLRLREVMQYAAHRHLQVLALGAPFGWSNGALSANGNLAEAQHLTGAQFEVDRSGKQLNFRNSFEGLSNGGFEDGKSDWFGTNDASMGLNHVAHSGKNSALIADPADKARFRQRITLQPWRQYHLKLWFKSSNFHGAPAVEVIDFWHRNTARFRAELQANGTHGWTQLEYTFNSQDTRMAYLYFGVWNAASGLMWFDDVELKETALVYVVRRPGAPLKIYDSRDPGKVFEEGRDYSRVYDERLGPPRAFFKDLYHTPPTVTLPLGTRMRPGETVAIDFYAIFPIPLDHQVGMCLTEPSVFQWVAANVSAIKAILPAGAGFLLSYDEMRQMNSCAGCRAKRMTAGELLAWNVRKTLEILAAEAPRTQLYIWSDMFDPYHNAVARYYQVEGDLTGSWKTLPASVTVINWDHRHLHDSLAWFAGSDAKQPVQHKQIIAGYYDSGNGGGSVETDLAQAKGVPGLNGFMYTTWADDYSQLESYSAAVRRGWDSYLASLSKLN